MLHCGVSGFHAGAVEDSSLLAYGGVLIGKQSTATGKDQAV